MRVERSRKKIKLVCLWHPFQNSYDFIMMHLLGKKSDPTMLEVDVILLDFKSLTQCEEVVSGFSSAHVTASNW
jgi:hypothetical protein